MKAFFMGFYFPLYKINILLLQIAKDRVTESFI